METAQYFDERSAEWSALYAQDRRFQRRYHQILRLLDGLHLPASGIALDAGCGSGVFSRTLAQRGFRVSAFDASPRMIAEAKAHIADNITYDCKTLESYSLVRDSYDLEIALSVLEYVDDAEKAIAKLASGLRDGGVLVVSVPNGGGMLRRIERVIYSIRKLTNDSVFRGRGEYLLYQRRQYSPKELDSICEANGLQRVDFVFLNSGLSLPGWLQPLFEQRWWAAIYCAAYRKQQA